MSGGEILALFLLCMFVQKVSENEKKEKEAREERAWQRQRERERQEQAREAAERSSEIVYCNQSHFKNKATTPEGYCADCAQAIAG